MELHKIPDIRKIIAGISFLLLAIVITNHLDYKLFLYPTTDSGIRNMKPAGEITRGRIYIQELRLRKNYLYAIDLFTENWGRENHNLNEYAIFSEENSLLYSGSFSSENAKHKGYTRINFHKRIRIGKGKKIYLCLSSADGSSSDNISVGTDSLDSSGKA